MNRSTLLNLAAAVVAVIALIVSVTHGHGDPTSARCESAAAQVTAVHDQAERLLGEATDDQERAALTAIAENTDRIICGVFTAGFAADMDDHRDTIAAIRDARSVR